MLIYKNSKNVKELKPSDFKVENLSKEPVPKIDKPILIIFYAHWCPHCSDPMTIDFMEALGNTLPNKAGIEVGAFSCADNSNQEEFSQSMGIMGYPTFRYYNNNKEMHEYRGPREVKPLLEFLLEKS